jgi:hypothetical protein
VYWLKYLKSLRKVVRKLWDQTPPPNPAWDDPEFWKPPQYVPRPAPPPSEAEILVECYRALDRDEALLLAARLSDHGIKAVSDSLDSQDKGHLILVRPQDRPRALAFLADDRPWLDDYKAKLAKVERKKRAEKYDTDVLSTDRFGQEKLFNLGRVKLILEGTGETNRGEFWVPTEGDEWHIMHVPFPGVDPDTGVPVPHRHTIQGEAADVAWWCRADHFQQFDPCGRPLPVYEGLPDGLLPTFRESQRILAWRAGRPTLPLDSGAGRQVEPTRLDPEWRPSGKGAPNQPPTRAAEQEQGLPSHQEAPSATKPVADPTQATSAPPQPTTPPRGATEGEQGPEALTAPSPAVVPTTPPPEETEAEENQTPPPAPASAAEGEQGPEAPTVKKIKLKAKYFKRGELDDKAYQLLSLEPGMSNEKIAERLGCHPKSLSSPKLTKFQKLREMLKFRKVEFRDPSRSGRKPPRRHGYDDDWSS